MVFQEATLDTAVWEDSTTGISVVYPLEVMQDLRRLAVDGFNAFAHGGREIGGVLYGKREDSRISVLSYVELECEHALGPRFILSEKDHVAMTQLVEARDGLHAVGWFRAHTRSGLELDTRDRELFDRYFERPSSAGLILKPTQWGPATGAFYVRRASGEVGPDSVREFAIDPPRRETAEEISEPVEMVPVALAHASAAIIVSEPAVPDATLAVAIRDTASKPRRGWPWAMCAGALLGAVVTFVVESHPPRQAVANTPPQRGLREAPSLEESQPLAAVIRAADRAVPAPTAVSPPELAIVTEALSPPVKADANQSARRHAHIPQTAPGMFAASAPLPVAPPASLDLLVAPKFPDLYLSPLSSASLPPAITATPKVPYIGPRQGRLIWTGDLGRHAVFEMDGSRVSLGSLVGALPAVPLAVRVMPAEFSRDGLTVFTSDPLRDERTEPPAKSNGWNALRFKVDPARARELVLLETPNAANDYKRVVVRNDGRQCWVVLVDWNVE